MAKITSFGRRILVAIPASSAGTSICERTLIERLNGLGSYSDYARGIQDLVLAGLVTRDSKRRLKRTDSGDRMVAKPKSRDMESRIKNANQEVDMSSNTVRKEFREYARDVGLEHIVQDVASDEEAMRLLSSLPTRHPMKDRWIRQYLEELPPERREAVGIVLDELRLPSD